MSVSKLMFNSTHQAQSQHCMAYRCSIEGAAGLIDG